MPDPSPPDRLRRIGGAGDRTVYYDDERGTYHTWWDDRTYEPVSTALLYTVASVQGVEPTEIEVLSKTLDPDALNAIFVHWQGDEPRIGDGTISFTYADCSVTVRSDGEIVVDPARRTSLSN